MMTPTDVVKTFLDAMGRRDFAAMEQVMASNFKMTVTGGSLHDHPRDFAAQSRLRQKSAKKTTDRYEEFLSGSSTVVYSIGSMAGEWNNGSTFSGIRYIDRFEVINGKIVDMNVWSDMSEFRPRD